MGDLDLVTKILMCAAPEAFVRLWLGREVEVHEVRAADKELQSRRVLMDKLYELRLAGEAGHRWLHVEVAAVWEHDLPYRMFDYWGMARRTVSGPIGSLLICLKPGSRQGRPTNTYREADAGTELAFRYLLVRAWSWTVGELLQGNPALLPFVPYAGDANVAKVDDAIRTADQVEPRSLRADLLAALAVFAQNVFKDVDWSARMPRELLMESAIYRQGEAAGERKLVKVLLETKLGDEAPRLATRLESCTEEQLEAMARLLVTELSREALVAALERLIAGS